MSRDRIFLVSVLIATLGCAGSGAPAPAPPQPANALSRDARVSVVEFDMNDTYVLYPEEVDGFGLALAEEIASQLRERGYEAEAVVAGGDAAGDVVVKGNILTIDGGSRSARYFSYGASGGTELAVEGSVVEAGVGQVGVFDRSRRAAFRPFFGGSTISMMDDCIRAVARDVAQLVAHRTYVRTGPAQPAGASQP